MKKLFKDIRRNDIEAVRAAIARNPGVVNEYFDGKAPKKDIGQSPLQVAIKCGQFEMIQLLLENGADPDFMEDPATVPPRSICMSVLHDAIIGAMDSLLYKRYEKSAGYVRLIETLLKKGANPNKETFQEDSAFSRPPAATLVYHAKENLSRYAGTDYCSDSKAFHVSKKNLFQILDLLREFGADIEKWLDSDNGFGEGKTNRADFLEDFVPRPDESYEIKYHGRSIKGIRKGDTDPNREIRAALKEYFNLRR